VYRENGYYEAGKNTLSPLYYCIKLPLFLHQTTDIVSFPRPWRLLFTAVKRSYHSCGKISPRLWWINYIGGLTDG